MTMALDLSERSIHALLVKKAGIPRSAMPWMNKMLKTKPKGMGIIPPAKKPTVMPNTVAKKPAVEPSPLSAKSIKAVGSMGPGGRVVRTKLSLDIKPKP